MNETKFADSSEEENEVLHALGIEKPAAPEQLALL